MQVDNINLNDKACNGFFALKSNCLKILCHNEYLHFKTMENIQIKYLTRNIECGFSVCT